MGRFDGYARKPPGSLVMQEAPGVLFYFAAWVSPFWLTPPAPYTSGRRLRRESPQAIPLLLYFPRFCFFLYMGECCIHDTIGYGRAPFVGLCRSFISVYVPGAGLPDSRASVFSVSHGLRICPGRAHPAPSS